MCSQASVCCSVGTSPRVRPPHGCVHQARMQQSGLWGEHPGRERFAAAASCDWQKWDERATVGSAEAAGTAWIKDVPRQSISRSSAALRRRSRCGAFTSPVLGPVLSALRKCQP